MNEANVDSIKSDGYAMTTFLTGVTHATVGNIALGKTCTASIGDPSHLTDGDFERIAANRWLTNADQVNLPWLEIDLAGEYSINRIQTYAINTAGSGPESDVEYPVTGMTFQVWEGNDWVTVFTATGITNPAYVKSFDFVTTSKVRFSEITSSVNATRWIEVEVYGYSTGNQQGASDTKIFLKDGKLVGQITDASMTVQTAGNQTIITHAEAPKLMFAESPGTNVALGKPVTASDIIDPDNAAFQPENAVDGIYATSTPRWVSTGEGEHWLEIDLQGEYRISSFKTWNGNLSYEYPVERLKLQAWIGNGWVDVADSGPENVDPCYGAYFEPVTTGKVRLYTYSQTRLIEIMVFSMIE
jgi:hypothetical protein